MGRLAVADEGDPKLEDLCVWYLLLLLMQNVQLTCAVSVYGCGKYRPLVLFLVTQRNVCVFSCQVQGNAACSERVSKNLNVCFLGNLSKAGTQLTWNSYLVCCFSNGNCISCGYRAWILVLSGALFVKLRDT